MNSPTDSLAAPDAAPGTAPAAPAGKRRGGQFALRDRPGVVWLMLAVVVALAHRFVPESRWLMVHLVMLGAMTHSAMVWSSHFTRTLLKTSDGLDPRRNQARRILLLIAGVTCVLVGVPFALWPLVVVGATLASTAVIWHGLVLWKLLRKALPGRFRISIRYYLAAAACLPVGAGFGATLAKGLDDDQHGRFLLAHTMTMVLGWLGLTVLGTLVTLWPTMLRTRLDERAETLARQALPLVLTALVVIDAGALSGLRAVAAVGLVGYLAAVCWWGRSLVRPARTAPPRHASTYFVSAALCWAALLLVLIPIQVATASSWGALADGYGDITSIAVVGFALQLLTGALSHLVPAVLGGGARVVRAAQTNFDRFAVTRLTVINLGLVLWLVPMPPVVRVLLSTLVLVALAAFIPLMFTAIHAAVAVRKELAAKPQLRGSVVLGAETSAWSAGQLVAAVAAIALAVSLGVAADPGTAGLAKGTVSAVPVTPTGHTTTVKVMAMDMHFTPSSVTVPKGDRLVIQLTNHDTKSPHDLLFPTGVKSPRVKPGGSTTMDLGVVGQSMRGWCTLVGHKAMGMTFEVVVVTGSSEAAPVAGSAPTSAPSADKTVPASFKAVDPTLPPLTASTVHKVTLTVREVEIEVAPGVRQKRWTFNGSVPGPTLHGRVGDTFEVTLVNDGSMGHSIDFHAGDIAPDQPMRTIAPGQSLVYRFTAHRAGIWMYHCSTMPMSAHIAAGMAGAVVIEPPGLPAVDRSYVFVQSEAYVAGDGRSSVAEVDADAVATKKPSFVTFNGVANQYDFRQPTAKVGDRVRIWVLDAGPNLPTSFHVVGAQFDTVYAEGAYLLKNGKDAFGGSSVGAQALSLAPAQGGFVEFTPREAGHYPFVSHVMSDAEAGAHGVLQVTH